ncbi:MAG: hypothetical protein AAF702_37985 [Chloroflexota bacterium]
MNKNLSYLLVALVLVVATVGIAFAQFGIGTTNPDPSAALDIVSTSQGFLPPRLTTAQRDAINGGTFAEGLTIYNTDDSCLQVWSGTSWNCIVGGDSGSSSSSTGSSTYVRILGPTIRIPDGYTQIWLDDNTFAIVENYGLLPDPVGPYDMGDNIVVKIYNANFAEQTRFVLPMGGFTTIPRVALLNNDNLVFAAGGPPSHFAITDQSGNYVKTWTTLTVAATPSQLIVLDNGRFVVGHGYGAFDLYEEDGTLVTSDGPASSRATGFGLAPTNFGFATIAHGQFDNTSNRTTRLYLYDFDGNQIAAPTFEPDPTNPFGDISSTVGDGSSRMELVRVSGNTFYTSLRRQTSGTLNDEYDGSIGSIDNFQNGLRQFQVDASGTITTLADILAEPEIGLNNDARQGKILAAHTDGRLFALGSVRPDIPLGHYVPINKMNGDVGFSIPILQYDALASYTGRTNLIYEDTFGLQEPCLPFNDNTAAPGPCSYSEHISLSPSGTYLLIGSSFTGVAYHSVLDAATMAPVPVQLQANNQPQDMRTRFAVLDPEEDMAKVEVTIIDGAGTFDTLNYIGVEPDISASYSAFNKKLTLTNSGSAISRDFSNASAYITLSPDAPAGTRTIEVAVFNSGGQTGTATFTVDVVAP